jgi:hypothetical protein
MLRMLRARRLVWAVLLTLGCSPAYPPEFVDTIRSAESLKLYEGLPRDGGHVPPERAGWPTVEIAGQHFWAGPRTLSGEEARALEEILSTDETFAAHNHLVVKTCGGFHADWAIEWLGDDGPDRVLLCFGCREALSVSADGAQHLNDLSKGGAKGLLALLAPR